ncbi:hypothetical protein E4T38_03269 [Aureobasidium subglaciale]|nr:hypothetical protein E4T38_03269 [Aureobasidium subglaciale]KAI5226511.1 hypothetical protein E4T40_03043 [Aureobasidium subglaciale]KAI5229840.1 hypothetical protein E4T41_03266 [Aureobasidium subglaciale]KAI5264397.1 hypothetical protein E4T46_03044 [Aureobasidium subglaciale]
MAPRSTGCAICRKRKIRCDEGRPGCKKCQIHNTPCPGYRGIKADGLEWRDETQSVTKRVERGWRSGSGSGSSGNSSPEHSSDSDSGAIPTERVRALSLVEKPVSTEYTIIPQAIFSAATNRSQMFDVSMRLYRPTTLDEQPLRAHISDFSCLQKTITSKSSPALLAAVDTISLLQLGVSYQDKAFFEHARRRYGQALTALVVALNKPDVLGNNDVLGAMKLLEFCELFRPVAQQGSWISHVNGVENFLIQRGPVPLVTELDNMLFFHARHSSIKILQGVLKRKAIVFAQPKWLAMTKETPYTDSSPRLFDVLVHIPGLFERADNLIASGESTYLNGIIADLVTAVEQLQEWEDEYHAELKEPAFFNVDVSKFKRFTRLCQNKTFPLAIDFPDFLTGYLQSIYWLYLFTILRSLQDILMKYRNAKCSLPMDEINKRILQVAIFMAQMMPYFCEPDASSMGRFATFMPLVFILKYFEARGMKAQKDWCQEITDAMFNDGINPPWRLDVEKGLAPGSKKQIT